MWFVRVNEQINVEFDFKLEITYSSLVIKIFKKKLFEEYAMDFEQSIG